MSFWSSNLGALSGLAEDAFTKTFKVIPDNTTAGAKIERFRQRDHKGNKYYEVDWVLTDGEFKGLHVFQKIHAFDADEKKKHKALNMMMYLYKLYNLSPKSNNPPTDDELKVFIGKYAGLRIQEWSAPKEDGSGMMSGNFISEVHSYEGFKSETGVKLEVVHNPGNPLETAFNRNPRVSNDPLNDDIPF